MKIYLLPGLGFDHRIFSKLDLPESDVQYIDWIDPVKEESIENYARRLAKDIVSDQDEVILIGHSLGGIMSQEIACFKKVDKVILISSIKSRKELPFYFKMIKTLFIHKLFTTDLAINTLKFWGKSHGYETKEEQDLFKDMVGRQSNLYMQWALKTLSVWKNPAVPKTTTIIQIHGSVDKTFPFNLIDNPNYTIQKGGHFMVYKDAERISGFIEKELEKIQ